MSDRASSGRLGNRIAPVPFVAFALVLVLATVVGWALGGMRGEQALIVAFDLAVLVFMAMIWPLHRDHTAAAMRLHAAANDANRTLLLSAAALASLMVFVAMLAELPLAREGAIAARVVLIATMALTWLFLNLVYMLHYAHMFYAARPDGKGDCGGFSFHGTSTPDYADFFYFALTAGMSFAASDVDVTSKAVRKVVVMQCLLAFAFNIGALAFTINVLAGS